MAKDRRDGICKVCRNTYESHSGKVCPACFVPVEHHDKASTDECWANRARMALARGQAGLDLNDTDIEAMRRCPKSDTLTSEGYQYVESAHAAPSY